MTELERQLTAALAEVVRAVRDGTAGGTPSRSKPCRRRVEQQAAQSETLRRQIEQLSGHVTGLDADYKTIAADVARVVELMHRHAQQRARERDSGPSR